MKAITEQQIVNIGPTINKQPQTMRAKITTAAIGNGVAARKPEMSLKPWEFNRQDARLEHRGIHLNIIQGANTVVTSDPERAAAVAKHINRLAIQDSVLELFATQYLAAYGLTDMKSISEATRAQLNARLLERVSAFDKSRGSKIPSKTDTIMTPYVGVFTNPETGNQSMSAWLSLMLPATYPLKEGSQLLSHKPTSLAVITSPRHGHNTILPLARVDHSDPNGIGVSEGTNVTHYSINQTSIATLSFALQYDPTEIVPRAYVMVFNPNGLSIQDQEDAMNQQIVGEIRRNLNNPASNEEKELAGRCEALYADPFLSKHLLAVAGFSVITED